MENKANKLFVQMAKKTQPTSNQDNGKRILTFQGLEKYIPPFVEISSVGAEAKSRNL